MTEPSYRILGAQDEGVLARIVGDYLARGYELAGGATIGRDGRFHQAVVKPCQSDLRPGEVRLREPKQKQR